MYHRLGPILAIVAGFVLAEVPLHTGFFGGEAAAQSTAKKSTSKKTTKKKKQATKKSYCGYPSPPNPAGMSDFCAMQYDLYCRRGVGCSIYGR
jgi:hypothetical protein